MYTPNFKQLANQYTLGDEFILNGKPYKGYYCLFSNGKYYTGPILTVDSKELNKIKPNTKYEEPNNILSQYINLKNDLPQKINVNSYIPSPTIKDYEEGIITRYFAKRIQTNDIQIIEINQLDYNNLNNRDNNYYLFYQTISIEWKISGPDFDNNSDPNNFISGIIDTNYRNLINKSKTMIGLDQYLKNLTEYSI